MKKKLILGAASTLMTLLLMEACLQILHVKKEAVSDTFLAPILSMIESPFSWKSRFTNAEWESGVIPKLTDGGLHQSHPTRGWALKPDVSVKRGNHVYTTNADGYRSQYPYGPDPERYTVLIVGDSFTFGDAVEDIATWPHLLQHRDARLNVLNLAGSGYGIDQMAITLSESIARYRPQLVIAAFIDDDLVRSLLDFRDFRKPRFVIRDGGLQLTNTPIGSVDEVLAELRRNPSNERSPIQLINLARKIQSFVWPVPGISDMDRTDLDNVCKPACTEINTALIERMANTSTEYGAEFLLAYIPYGPELTDRDFLSYGEHFFENYRKGHSHRFLNTRKRLLQMERSRPRGWHYGLAENKVLEETVHDAIQAQPSWKKFTSSGTTH